MLSGLGPRKKKKRVKENKLLYLSLEAFIFKPVIKLRISFPQKVNIEKNSDFLINWYSLNNSFQAFFEYQVLRLQQWKKDSEGSLPSESIYFMMIKV